MGTDAWCGEMPEDLTSVSRRAYYASIEFVDEWIGSIIGALKATGKLDNTLYGSNLSFFSSILCSIMFTADHGDMQGDHYHWRKSYPYEGRVSHILCASLIVM
jgi:arylsulfatase A-like enzyme